MAEELKPCPFCGGEAAEPIRPVAVMRSVVGDAFDHVVSTVIEEQHGERHEFDARDCILAFYDTLEELEAAVRAEARAALLREFAAPTPDALPTNSRNGTPRSPRRRDDTR